MDSKLKVGIIGFGRMGGFYLAAMQQSGEWDVAYICDVCQESRESSRTNQPGQKTTFNTKKR